MKTNQSKSTPAQQPSTTSFFDQQKSEGQFFGEQQQETEADSFFPVQTKLSIGSPNDQYEKEADANADRVVSEISNPDQSKNQASNTGIKVQRKCAACEAKEGNEFTNQPDVQRKPIFESDAEPNVQMKCAACGNDLDVQTKADTTETDSTDNLSQGLSDSKGKGSALPDTTRNSMESAMGADFSNVRVHDDEKANQMNEGLGAQAFTHGSDIYFNDGKYNPSTSEGQHLLAHELTHTMQQGASPSTPSIQKDEDAAADTDPLKPNTALDITHRFAPDEAWANYIESNRTNVEVDVVIGNDYEGTLIINQTLAPQEGRPGKYDLSRNRRIQYLTVKGMSFLNPMKESGVEPILVLRNFGDDQLTTGFLSVKIAEEAIGDVIGLVRGFNERMEAMSFIGLDQFTLPGADIENTFEQGRLVFSIPALSTTVDGFLTASVGVGIVGNSLTFDLSADVDIEGLASGEFTMSRDESGQLSGRATISADIANIQASILVEYIAGAVTIQGTGRMESEKFSGEITLLVTDRNRADEMMHAALGVNVMDSEAENPESPPAAKTPENQVLVGWGEVTASITPWLEGTAKVGIDSEGHVTVVGEIVVPDEIELMEQRGKKIQLIDFEVRVGYGVPLVGQVFIFGGIGLFINAGFGPLVLRDIRFTGTYSTDPNILQEFSITGALGINAFAILGLEAEAGVGVTLLGHDVKAGINVTAAAGLRAYAEARPTFEYVERQAPEGGKVGEAFLRGHFEAAAQLFLMLSGAFFVELDSPWWSPAPDDRWEYPLGSVEYPIGDSLGVGADVEWLVGSNEIPELAFTPVEFDPEKFTADVMADPPPGRGGGDADEQGDWNDGTGGGDLEENPNVEEGGEGLEGRNQQDLTQLPDEEKYMRALSEVSDIAEDTRGTPPTERVLNTKLNRIKSRYAVSTIRIDENNDDHALVYVAHARENNRRNLVRVPIMSEAERVRLMTAAMADFERMLDGRANDDGKLLRGDADSIATQIADDHTVIESIRVIDGGNSWDFQMDIGDRDERVPGRGKAETEEAQQDPNSDANEELDPEEKARRVQEGLRALHQEEQQYLEQGAIAREEAEQVVISIRARFPIFTSLEVIDGDDTWDYRYTASPSEIEQGAEQEENTPPEDAPDITPGSQVRVFNGRKWDIGTFRRYTKDHGQWMAEIHVDKTGITHFKRIRHFDTDRGWKTYTTGIRNIVMDSVDALGRATRVTATIGMPLERGTNASYTPPGLISGTHQRGHLLGKQFGGSGSDPRNITPLFRNANSPVMSGYERQVRNAIENNSEIVEYTITPIYDGNSLVPTGVRLQATGDGGFTLNIEVPNTP